MEGAIFGLVGFLSLILFRESNYPWLLQKANIQKDPESQSLISHVNGEESPVSQVPDTLTGPDSPSSFIRSLRLFLHPYFLVRS